MNIHTHMMLIVSLAFLQTNGVLLGSEQMRSAATTSGIFAQCSAVTASYAAVMCHDMDAVDFSDVTDVYVNHDSNVVLKRNQGTGVCWGGSSNRNPPWPAMVNGTACPNIDFSGVTDVRSTHGSFLFWSKNAGTGQCWGSHYGEDCSHIDFSGVTDVFSNGQAYIALNKNAGTAQCWGGSQYGGDCDGMDFTGVTDIYDGSGWFLAVDRNSGRGFNVGAPSWWPDQTPFDDFDFSGDTDIHGLVGGVVVVNRQTGGAVGLAMDYLSSCEAINFTGVTDVYGRKEGPNSFMLALNRNAGTGQCCGYGPYGADCSAVDFSGDKTIYAADGAGIAWDKDAGTAQCWGNAGRGGDCNHIDFSGVTDIFPNEQGFIALNTHAGTAQCWGTIDCSTVDFSNVRNVFTGISTMQRHSYTFLALPTLPNLRSKAVQESASGGSGSAAKGDPHLVNIKGEAFDVMQTGNMMLLEIPRKSSPATLDLALHADIEHLGVMQCGPTFITRAYITGRWVGMPVEIRSGPVVRKGSQSKHAFAMRLDGKDWVAHAEMQGTMELSKDATITVHDRMFLFHVRDLDIVVSQPKRPRTFLDIQVKGLGNLKSEIGGLLGLDDHSAVQEPVSECKTDATSLKFARMHDEDLQWSAHALL